MYSEPAARRGTACKKPNWVHTGPGVISHYLTCPRGFCIICPKQSVSFARRQHKLYNLSEKVISIAKSDFV